MTSQIRDWVREKIENGKNSERQRVEQKVRIEAVRVESKLRNEEGTNKARGIITVKVLRTPQRSQQKEVEEYLVDLVFEKEMVEKVEKVEGRLQVKVKVGNEKKEVKIIK